MSHTTTNNNGSKRNRVIAMLRVSTDQQDTERQRMQVATGVARHDLEVVRWVDVADVSGRHFMEDARYSSIVADMEAGLADGIIVAEQSRLVRPEDWDGMSVLTFYRRHKKFIYTPSDCMQAWTRAGWYTLTCGAMIAGDELQTIRERLDGGKEKLRAKGLHPGGNQSLPRGIRYVRERNADGKVIATRWEHDGIDSERVRRAYELLFAGVSFEAIAEAVGGFTGKGIRESLMNPLWKSVRVCAFEAKGEEVKPRKATAANPNQKRRRLLTRRAAPLEVALDGLDGRPYLEPIITAEAWARAQEIIAAKAASWRRSKVKNEGRPRPIATGIGKCSCGAALYHRYGSGGRSDLDAYYCSTRHPNGKGCGAQSIKRIDFDAAVEALVLEQLLNADFVLGIVEHALELRETSDPNRGKREAAVAQLEGGRRELMAAMRKGYIGAEDFKREVEALEVEVRALQATLPAPAPAVSGVELVRMIGRTFQHFATLTAEEKRGVLQSAVAEVVLDAAARTVPSVTLNGGYLGNGANSPLRSTPTCQFSAIADIAVRFPQPIAIPDTYVNGRAAYLASAANLERMARGRAARWTGVQ